jgi:hypothetical protein
VKHSITIEDMPDGSVCVTSDPPLEEVFELCATPERMTSADGYAAEVHIAIKRTSDAALRDAAAANRRPA